MKHRLILYLFLLLNILFLTCNSLAAQSDSLLVQMYNGKNAATINTIFPWFKITNLSSEPIDLSKVKIRYFYTIDGERAQNFWCDWASIGSQNVTGTFTKLPSAFSGADHYFELSFKQTAGMIQPGQSIEVHNRFAKDDWSNYYQNNDYSFNPIAQTYADTDKLTVIVDDESKTGSVQGIVLTETGLKVSNADVKLVFSSTGQEFTTKTDSYGIFTLDKLPLDGNFVIFASTTDGHIGSVNSFINSSYMSETVTVVMTLPGIGIITGNVVSEDGTNVANAVVSLAFIENDYTATVVTDENGYFSFTNIPTNGSFSLVAFDPVTAAVGSTMSYLTSSSNTQKLNLTLKTPKIINESFSNGDFVDGTFSGWEVSGDAKIVPLEEVFQDIELGSTSLSPLTPIPSITVDSVTTEEASREEKNIDTTTKENNCLSNTETTSAVTSAYSGIISTAGDNNAVGKASYSFIVTENMDTLVGRIRFLSNEYPQWYGSQYNDSYIVYLASPTGTQILAKGNLNSSSWGAGVAGYNGATKEITVSANLSKYVGQKVTLVCEVSDVGDMVVDSALAISNFKIVWKNNRIPVETGYWDGSTDFSMELGQVVWLTVKNVNVLGTTISVRAYAGGQQIGLQKDVVLIPGKSSTFRFSVFANEPVTWKFYIDTYADAFQVQYTIESTWKPGMPPNE